jgi:hypothetical protein
MNRLSCLLASAALAFPGAAVPQSRVMTQGSSRMEIMLERMDGAAWRTIDPGLVLNQGDRVRFRFRTNFDGYLYVMNQSTSGKYEQLFPREETGTDNVLKGGQEYYVPATKTVFRIAGPAGYETVYWMVTPARLTDTAPEYKPLPPPPSPRPVPSSLIPRCDDALLKARGDCIDSSAGPKLVPRGADIPPNLQTAAKPQNPRDLVFLRQKDTAVISSPTPLTGPVIYEFRLAHR